MAREWLSTIPTQHRYDITTFERNDPASFCLLPVVAYDSTPPIYFDLDRGCAFDVSGKT
jgi:hypothetical protein